MRVLIVLAFVALLSACTTGSRQNVRAPTHPPAQQVDYARVAAVESNLRNRYADVIWVNQPMKRNVSDEQ